MRSTLFGTETAARQREFLRELGVQAGFVIDWSKVARQQMIAASRDCFATGDSSGLAALIRVCLM